MMVPSLIMMLFFDDDRTLGIHSEAVTWVSLSFQTLLMTLPCSLCPDPEPFHDLKPVSSMNTPKPPT
jgi:hypothetical protein